MSESPAPELKGRDQERDKGAEYTMMNETMTFGTLRRGMGFGGGVLSVLLSLVLAGCAVRSGQPLATQVALATQPTQAALPPLPTIGGVAMLYSHGYTSYTAPWVDSYTAEHGRLGWLVGLCDDRPVVPGVRTSESRSGEGDLFDIRVNDVFYARFLDSEDGQGLPPMPTQMSVSSRDELIRRAIGRLLRHATPTTRDTNARATNGDGSDERGTGDHAAPTNHHNGAIGRCEAADATRPSPKASTTMEDEIDAFLRAEDWTANAENMAIGLAGRSVDRAVAHGLEIVPMAVRRMSDPDLPFEGFARLYGLCMLVLRKAGQPDVYWSGGAHVTRDPDGRYHLAPRGQFWWDDEDGTMVVMFRHVVVGDIARKYMVARVEAEQQARRRSGTK